MEYEIRSLQLEDREIVNALTSKHFGETRIGYIDQLIDTTELPGFVAIAKDEVIGQLTWRCFGKHMQVMTLISERENQGVGTALLKAAEQEASRQGLSSVLISTENSNIDSLRFYQRRGYVLHELHKDAVRKLRELKPSIPLMENGIPIRDEIDLLKEVT